MNITRITNWNIRNADAIFISPTNYCDSSCIMCPSRQSKQSRGFMKWNLFTKIIDEIEGFYRKSDLLEVHLYNDGEPFCHPRYIDMLEYIDKKLSNLVIMISTNGYRFEKPLIDRVLQLINNRYVIVFSIDSSNALLYETIKGHDNYENVEKNVQYILEEKYRLSINNRYVVLQFVVMAINEHDRHTFYWKWEPLLGPAFKVADVIWHADIFDKNNNGSHVYWKKYDKQWSNFIFQDTDWAKYIKNPHLKPFKIEQHKLANSSQLCAWPWKRLIVGWDGNIGLCCFRWDSNGICGNIVDATLFEVFSGPSMTHIRNKFLIGEHRTLPVCNTCPKDNWWRNQGLETYFEL